MKIYCIPYAGGSAQSFAQWKKEISENYIFQPFELAGRGIRSDEPCKVTIQQTVKDLYEQIDFEKEYVLFGHSMGALIVFELYRYIKRNNRVEPEHLFLSGFSPPSNKKQKRAIENDSDLILLLKQWGGTPEELIQNQSFLDYYLPILRSDLSMLQVYNYDEEFISIDCNVTVFCGSKDYTISSDMMGWKDYVTQSNFNLFIFEGGHFFIDSQREEVLRVISSMIL